MKRGSNKYEDGGKDLLDVSSFIVVVGVLIEWLPTMGAGLSVIWLAIRIWESETVRLLTRRETQDERHSEDDGPKRRGPGAD